MIKFFAGLTACFVVLCAGYAIASRNSSGTYSIPNTFTSGSVISSSAVNANFSDIGTELTSSLDRAGRGAMTAQLQLASGTVTTPGLGFSSDTGSGLYRIGSANLGFAISGVKVGEWSANGYRTASGVVATPSLSFTADTGDGWYRAGSHDIRFAVSGADKHFLAAAGYGLGIAPTASFHAARSDGLYQFKIERNGGTDNKVYGIAVAGTVGAPSLVIDDVTAGVTRLKILSTGQTVINTGIGADGSGFKHQSVAGCATGAAIGATCTSTLTWTTAFSDSGYQAVCSCNAVTSGLPIIRSYTNSGDGVSITLTTMAMTAAAAQCSVIVCMAAKD